MISIDHVVLAHVWQDQTEAGPVFSMIMPDFTPCQYVGSGTNMEVPSSVEVADGCIKGDSMCNNAIGIYVPLTIPGMELPELQATYLLRLVDRLYVIPFQSTTSKKSPI